MNFQEFKSLVTEAFITKSFTKMLTPSRTKEITVDFSFDINEGV